MSKAQFGMIGLGVMGRSLALNIADHGFPVAVWNLEPEWVDRFVAEHGAGRTIVGTKSFESFVATLERPRRIMMMIAAGRPIDTTLEKLVPLLDDGDVVIDGGNSWFKDTREREARLRPSGRSFLGCGVSGGEEGARNGPSLMPGGDTKAYEVVRPVLEAIAARSDSGACVAHCGPDGAGHFVKMVHNGIEYGDMQLIAEAYEILRVAGGLTNDELAGVFALWNEGPLESFLVEVTSRIFRVRDDETGAHLVDLVLDKAGQKGTGKWTAQVALDLGVAIPTIAAAIDARVLSSMKDERVAASAKLHGPDGGGSIEKASLIADVHDALLASKICSYAQGMSLIGAGSCEWAWGIDLAEMARIWTGGCIIRARLLDAIRNAYAKDGALANLLVDDVLAAELARSQGGWRRAVALAQTRGVAIPAMSASLAYFDAYRASRLPANLVQAQRDYFGAHTYERVDRPGLGFVHTDWKAKSQ